MPSSSTITGMGGGPFALPVPGYRLGIHASKRRRLRAEVGEAGGESDQEKRERGTASLSPAPESLYSHSQSRPHSQLPPDAINPRSHSPDTLRQFAVAGLAVEEEVPSAAFPLFPHKPLPLPTLSSGRRRGRRTQAANDATADADADAGGADALSPTMVVKRHSARLKHLGTVTAIMHRCLSEGDVARAKRAFGLLVRTREVDIRANHLWTVGAEILMRDGETISAAAAASANGETKQRQRRLKSDEMVEVEDGEGEGEGEGEGQGNDQGRPLPPPPPPPLRWGSTANFDAVRAYFENLIQQHPHDPHRPHLTSALDFWPVLYGIEIYNTDAEFRAALHQLDVAMAASEDEEDEGEGGEEALHGGFGFGFGYGAEEGADDEEERRMEARMRQRQKERDDEVERRNAPRWAARDELRHETRTAAQRIAARMDETMLIAPYTKHLELLRLRGMLALFIGDMHLPARLIDVVNRSGVDADAGVGVGVGATSSRPATAKKISSSKTTSLLPEITQSLARAARGPEERSALMSRREEQERARGFFARIVENKGVLDGWVKRFVEEEEDDDNESASDEFG
ncbi:hypothetical protein SLS62_008504 [Diatrype stigma]|uniref:Uncharacterized protein n=1 Tax=Diatrype stigma TaxID=117547 RepID=A0AAN9UKZ0_9PEZI